MTYSVGGASFRLFAYQNEHGEIPMNMRSEDRARDLFEDDNSPTAWNGKVGDSSSLQRYDVNRSAMASCPFTAKVSPKLASTILR